MEWRDYAEKRANDRRSESLDEAFALLDDERRRFVLVFLRDRGHAGLLELADVVAGWEQTDRDGTVATREDRDRIAARLHHVDLPKLGDAGVVTYDPRSHEISFERLPPAVEAILERAIDWQINDERGPEDRSQDDADLNRR